MSTADPPSHPDDPPTVRVEGYEGFRRIGTGGFSAVYRARQSSLGREVAVKVLHADLSSPAERRTFERECRAMGKLSAHPNIVTVYSEAFTSEGRPCIVMELYGRSYRERLDASGPLALGELLELGVKLGGALQSAHDAGVLHRDLKPHNVFVSDFGEPALGDFGISSIDDERSITSAGGLSIAYAAPEVLEEAQASVASDVYGLGATLYHLAGGSAPFAADDLRTTVRRILTDEVRPLERPDAPAELDAFFGRALAKRPADRYRSAAELAEALRAVQRSCGFDVTPIPFRRTDADGAGGARSSGSAGGAGTGERTVPRTRPGSTPAMSAPAVRGPTAAAPRVHATGQAADGVEVAAERTVVRERRRAAAPDAEPETEGAGSPSPLRSRVGIGLGVLAIAVVALLLIVPRGGDDDVASTTTVITVAQDDTFFTILAPPTDVVVTTSASGDVEITVGAVPGATSYEAESVSPSTDAGVRTQSDTPSLSAPVDVSLAPCWVVRALGDGGRISDDSAVACAEL